MSHLVLCSNSNLVFKVRRQEPELIGPAKPSPREVKLLSDMDDQEELRAHVSTISIYPGRSSSEEYVNSRRDPVNVIRAALAEALVYYYPLAGRVREIGGRKLVVDCTGEGVIFVEADAGVRLEDLGEEICPPFPWREEVVFNPPGSANILNTPLFLIQVTRMLCGGFIIGIRTNHTLVDAVGSLQFLEAVADIAKGASQPSILPVWKRELIMARDPPKVTCTHSEYDIDDSTTNNSPALREQILGEQMEVKSFFIGPEEVSTLRRLIPSNHRGYSTLDLLLACLWRCRTIALQYNPDDEVRALFIVNVRSKFDPPLPTGYYGNAIAFSAAITTAEKLLNNPPEYALTLIRDAKAALMAEHLRSLLDFLVVRGRPPISTFNSYYVTDIRRAAFTNQVDFGWGKSVYAGCSDPSPYNFFMSYRKISTGIEGILVIVSLPPDAMERFTMELGMLLKTGACGEDKVINRSTKILSSM